MNDAYVWGLDPWLQLVLWIGGILAYICAAGFTWAMTPESWNSRDVASLFWPVTLVLFIGVAAFRIGPRAITRWRERSRLPRAQVR